MMVSDVPQIIESCGFCRAEKVKSLQTMKSGMTNRSYSFCVDDKRYIIRIPGEGTDRLINRKQEHAVYNAISSLGISEDVYYFDPKSGIKIAAYLTDAHVCDSSNWEEVERCLSALKNSMRRSCTFLIASIFGNVSLSMRAFGMVRLPFTRIMTKRSRLSLV